MNEINTPSKNRLLTEKDVANRLRASLPTVRRWRLNGHGPDYFKLAGSLVRYDREVVEEWLQKQIKAGDRSPALATEGAN